MNIYVGNLPYKASEQELSDLFSQHGAVNRASIITDRDTGRSKGFGFVEMPENGQAEAAIEAINGSDMGGRSLIVNEARPKTEKRW